jgi:hypothetical protein
MSAAPEISMTIDPDRIETVEDARLWAVKHQTEVDGLWTSQHRHNARNHQDHEKILTRLSAIEKRLIYAAGFIAAVVGLATFLGVK